ncbi:hypothetical protein ACFFLZ_06070 [Photobacterium aphoticum]|uniref:Pilus formation protein N-terminal domain-containing protein n=1 Tax=Photobacterium aphoticum TaxID=754436 RepID=A0A0J1GR78_9GAMM|nr:hypothetical protein [Photobacterium aphoticum]KLV01944.1 hypothetical protein ABT58_05980 [Photobacterium aphoticum]PSU60185.1 hypothetical protein C9I90_00740 [Photobacterium aphoticum]GHA33873.1 hypothetical protein GCM10007086_03950 [Photobacterium aphoticum]
MKKLLLALALIPSFASANVIPTLPDVVKLAGPYEITENEAQSSVIHLYIPENGIGVVGILGGDKFSVADDSSNSIQLSITDNENTVFIDNNLSVGKATTIGIGTYCGRSISISVHSIGNDSKAEQIKPKLAITSTACPASMAKKAEK